jgi:2-methylcitrate dehydratase PrpD
MPSVSEQAAAWSAGLDLSAIPAEVVAGQRWRILDTLGVALAGSALDYGQRIRAGTLALGGQGHAHMFGRAQPSPMALWPRRNPSTTRITRPSST